MSSKYGPIVRANGRSPEPAEAPANPATGPTGPELATPPAAATSPPPATPGPSPALPEPEPRRGPGRPKGKRSDPAFDQVSAYVPHDLYRDVKVALLEDDQGQEFSELVAELLVGWLASRNRG